MVKQEAGFFILPQILQKNHSGNYYYDTETVDEAGNPLDAVAKYGSRNNRLMYYTSKKWDVVNGNPTLSSSETTWYYYNDYGHVERIVTKNSEENLYRGTRMEYDKMGRVWRVTNDQWVEDWRYFETDKTNGEDPWGMNQYWGVLAVDQAMSWDNAQSYVDTTYNANYFWYGLAKVRNELELQWFVDTFSPEDGSEVKYWIDGYQDGDPGDPYYLPGTWGCWLWEAQMGKFYDDPEETYVPWIPVGETPPWPDFNISGGWLAGEPDDVDGVENGQENRMLLVLNRGGVVGDYGFEDAAGSEQHPFLVMAGTSAKDFDPPDTLGGYQENWSRRFSYLGDRQRIADVEIGGSDENDKFTDYVGNAPVLDYWDPSGNATALTAYVPGLAEIDLFDEVNEVPWAAPVVTYLYTDMLGSTWFKTSDPASGTVTATLSTVRTAFGEIIAVGGTGPDSRYGYVGAHGYQEHDYDSGDGGTTYRGDGVPDNLIGRSATDGFPYMHVGARYYNPSTGRFMQRDPIGIFGGLNVYEYVGSSPTNGNDPSGLKPLMTGEFASKAALIGWLLCEAAKWQAKRQTAKNAVTEQGDPEHRKPFNPDNPWEWNSDGERYPGGPHKPKNPEFPVPPPAPKGSPGPPIPPGAPGSPEWIKEKMFKGELKF